jgi:hypothetical protein
MAQISILRRSMIRALIALDNDCPDLAAKILQKAVR